MSHADIYMLHVDILILHSKTNYKTNCISGQLYAVIEERTLFCLMYFLPLFLNIQIQVALTEQCICH